MKSLCQLLFFLSFFACQDPHSNTVSDVKIIAHRGASAYLPEHSLLAASYAHALGADFLEVDVVLTSDDVPIIVHDITLESTTDVEEKFPNKKREDGHFYAIDFSLSEIKKLNIHQRKDLKTQKDIYKWRYLVSDSIELKIPSLKEYLEHLKNLNRSTKKRVGLYLEIKKPLFHLKHQKDITKISYQLIKSYGLENKAKEVFIQCFYPETLMRLSSEFKSKIPRILLLADNSWNESDVDYERLYQKDGIEEILPHIQGFGPWIEHLIKSPNKQKFIKDMQKKGKKSTPTL